MADVWIRRSNERGVANHGWLKSFHSFSFGDYYDPAHMGFSVLRVINDDRVLPGQGFSTHSHRNMEIISLVLDGRLAHKDSEGHEQELHVGEVQLMSAGFGIRHSEFNPSRDRGVHFLQIWIEPNVIDAPPTYQQKAFVSGDGFTLLASPDAEAGSLVIRQNARVYKVEMAAGQLLDRVISPARHYYLHVIAGELEVNGEYVAAGDAVKLEREAALKLQTLGCRVQALFFDLP